MSVTRPIPMPANITKKTIEIFLNEYENSRSFLKKYTQNHPKFYRHCKKFVSTIPADTQLNLTQLFHLAFYLYNMENYEKLNTISNFDLQKTRIIGTQEKIIRDFADNIFGIVRSAGFSKLFCEIFRNIVYASINYELYESYVPFGQEIFQAFCRIPASHTEALANILVFPLSSAETFCVLLPDTFHLDYLGFLARFIRSQQGAIAITDYIAKRPMSANLQEILYALFWLKLGCIDSEHNRTMVNLHMTRFGRLNEISLDVSKLCEIEKQEIFQNIFNLLIKKPDSSDKEILAIIKNQPHYKPQQFKNKPLAANINKADIELFFQQYQNSKSFSQKYLQQRTKPDIHFRKFIASLPTNENLNFTQQFQLAYCLYDIESHENIYTTTTDSFLKYSKFSSLSKLDKIIRRFANDVFGETLSASLSTLFSTTYTMSVLPFDDIYRQNFAHESFTLENFATLTRIPAEHTSKLVDTLLFERLPTYTICSLIPDKFNIAYLDFLVTYLYTIKNDINQFAHHQSLQQNIINKLPRKDYLTETLYGLFWLQLGKIDTEENKKLVLYYAESLAKLNNHDPNTEKLGAAQKAFNQLIKNNTIEKKEILLSHIKNAHSQPKTIFAQFFATKSKTSSVAQHPLGDIAVIDHIISFIRPKF
jgi:hypothetical protein